MIPLLIDIGFIRIPTFGVFLVLAFFWSCFILWKHTLLTSYKEVDVFDCAMSGLIGGVLIGRIIYVGLHLADVEWSFMKFILINGYPGIHLTGFLIGFLCCYYICARYKKIPFDKYIDNLMTPLFIALGIGKLGAFLAGVEIGTQTMFPLALRYTHLDGARHLTALYESMVFFGASYISYHILMRIRRGYYEPKLTFGFFGFMYGFVTLVSDPLKIMRIITYGVSIDMIVSAVILLTSIIYLIYHFRTKLFVFAFKRK